MQVLKITEQLLIQRKPVFKMDSRCPGYRWVCTRCHKPNSIEARTGDWTPIAATAFTAAQRHWEDLHGARVLDWLHARIRMQRFCSLPVFPDTDSINPSEGLWIRLENGVSVSGTPFTQNYAKEEKKGMSRLSDIEARLRELEKEAARYARFPKTDEWPTGTVIVYDWSPARNDAAEVFTYAVLKADNGKWYWTGHGLTGKSGGDYDRLVENLADDNVSDIRIATPEDFDPLFPELTDLMSEEDAAKVEAFLANSETGVKVERPARREGGIFVPVVKGSEK